MFHTDDAMFLSKAVTRMPARYRLEADGLWHTVGQWCAHEATEGYCTIEQIHQLSPLPPKSTNHRIALLVDTAGLWSRVEWEGQPAILFRDWDVWQDTAEQTKARRDSWRDRKRRQRAAAKEEESSENSSRKVLEKIENSSRKDRESDNRNGLELHGSENVPRDIGGDRRDMSRPPLSLNPLVPSNSPLAATHESNAHKPPQPPRHLPTFTEMAGGTDKPPPPDPGPHAQQALWCVRQIIPSSYPASDRGKLALQVERLLVEGHPPQLLCDALGLWLAKPHLGPSALPSLVSEVLKLRDSQPRTRSPSAKAQGHLDVAAELIAERQRQRQTDQPGALEA